MKCGRACGYGGIGILPQLRQGDVRGVHPQSEGTFLYCEDWPGAACGIAPRAITQRSA